MVKRAMDKVIELILQHVKVASNLDVFVFKLWKFSKLPYLRTSVDVQIV